MSTPPFLDLPAVADRRRVVAARGELAALVAAPGRRAGAPALLVPGFTGSKEDFIAILEPIVAAGHEVVAIDQRGQFESPGEDDLTAYDLKALAEDVLAVARSLGEPVHLVGHSFGGLVARAAALTEPSALRSLTLMSSGPAAIPQPAAGNLQLLVQALPAMDLDAVWAAKRQLESAEETEPHPPEIEAWLHRRFVANHPMALLRLAEQLLGEEDRVAELATVDVPVLVLFGESDDAWPPAVQRDMATRLGAQVRVIEAAAHSPAAERPKETAAALLGFWSNG